MRTIIDAYALPTTRRAEAWADATAAHGLPLALTPRENDSDDDFGARVEFGSVGEMHLFLATLHRVDLTWSPARGTDAQDDPAIVVVLDGEFECRHGSRAVRLRTGDICLIEPRSAYVTHHEESSRILVAVLPRANLENRIGPVAPLADLVLPRAALSSQLVATHLTSLIEQSRSELNGPSENELVRVVIDLLVFALNDRIAGDDASPVPSRTANLLRLEQAILRHLRDADATSEVIASAAGLSVRRANALLAGRDTSLMRELTTRRVDRVGHDLAHPANANRPVADVARSWGFRHMSRFAGRFRQQWGVSPQEFRQAFPHTQKGG